MKNKSFENYYDDIHVDDSLLQQIPIKKHHYLKPILVISCCLLLFVCIFQNKQISKDTLEVLAYNQSYNSITTKATPMDYYLVHDQVDSNETQVKKKYEDKYLSKKADFKQSKLDIKDSYLNGYLTTCYFRSILF